MTQSESHETAPSTNEELLREFFAWGAKDRLNAIRAWHQGALSVIHLHVLTVLEANGPMPMGELAEALDVSVASATGLISRMETRGLIERRRDDADRRLVVIAETEAGANVFRALEQRRRMGLEALLQHLSEADRNGFMVGLRALHAARAAAAAAGAEAEAADAAEAARIKAEAKRAPKPSIDPAQPVTHRARRNLTTSATEAHG